MAITNERRSVTLYVTESINPWRDASITIEPEQALAFAQRLIKNINPHPVLRAER